MKSPETLEIAPEEQRPHGEEESDGGAEKSGDDAVVDVSSKNWEVSLFERSPPSNGVVEGLYVFHNTFHLIPRTLGQFPKLKTLKFFANEVEVLPPEVGDLAELERLQLKLSLPGVSRISLKNLKALKELELCRAPPRPSAFSIMSEISSLKCLTKLSVCHFSIRYLPPEIGYLKKLEELDLSFNKLKSLPNDIAELNALKLLKVANNKLVDLPSGISSLRRLENLDLSNNRLTSLTSLKLTSMHTLQYLNLQYNKLLSCCSIPSWICCNFEGNGEYFAKKDIAIEVDHGHGVALHRAHGSRSCNGCHGTPSSLYSETMLSCRCCVTQRMKRGWKRRDYIQQRARQERLNHSRKWKGEDLYDDMAVKMVEESNSCELFDRESSQSHVDEDKQPDTSAKSSILEQDTLDSIVLKDDGCDPSVCSTSIVSQNLADCEKICLNEKSFKDGLSCITPDSSVLNKDYDFDTVTDSNDFPFCPVKEISLPSENSSSEASSCILKSKRHSEKDLQNPKPSKFRKPVDNLNLSCKYSTESFCSINDHLPDGFYDAGRDRPFMSLHEYEQSLCLDSREVILLDREKDEELDAIALSAQILLSSLIRSNLTAECDELLDNLQRASILALFVSNCFGGTDRSNLVLRTRKAIVGSNKQKPFVCTCSSGNVCDNPQTCKQMYGIPEVVAFTELCEKSLRLIKEKRNSSVVPIGIVRFGVCRHRAVLMKYLCDRADPPIPCELVRGYLDFMPHAWNAILVKKGVSWVRMVVDACHPTDIREETDPEYFCRYVPLCRVNVPLTIEDSSILGCSFPSPSLYPEVDKASPRSVVHCKFGNLDAAVKVRNLQASKASDEEIRNFEYAFLGEVRMLGALRKNRHIVQIYGHQLSTKWVDGNSENRLLQSMIVMENVKGGCLKNYLEKLSKKGENYVPLNIALSIAKDVAYALVEVHSKQIIHRDIKSENILIDLECQRSDGSPIVKLSDFDRSVPLHSLLHSCCIAHIGIHPPDVCVGTPRWMAPEVVRAMHQRNPYGLEVDIWSYGCLLLELLTLKVPYEGKTESELYDLLQMKQRPQLPTDLEALALADDRKTKSTLGVYSDADPEILELLVSLFYQCTEGNPTDRPTAQHIYKKLSAVQSQTDAAQLRS
ncbi:hypothetical protein J5N97_009870 [Dioscorea zingiberensis]|uniref:Protein kinase domain-containing protein n=1 Tax=Dioscorea zingiberensis TaxID=325984 RepID=A0A9D5HLW7_9LILI|nr:hypothetical protein J5N97_009870 [Dioscorea zingiberensis]